jgi:hypothetical protein
MAPTRQAIAAEPTPRQKRITGRLKAALDLMVFGDETGRAMLYDEAARKSKSQHAQCVRRWKSPMSDNTCARHGRCF